MSSQDKTAVQPVGGKTADKVFRGVAYACGILILVVLAAVFLFLFFRAWPLIGGDQAANSHDRVQLYRRQGQQLLGLRAPAVVRYCARVFAGTADCLLRVHRHCAVHFALCT